VSQSTLALIGPGRAGTTIALALVEHGWEVAAVAGRAPDAASTRAAAACLGARTSLVADVAAGAGVVLVATPDAAIEQAASAAASSIESGALVFHLAGSRGLEVFQALHEQRPDIRLGALHPLVSFPSTSAGLERLPGAWAAVAGDEQITDIAKLLALRPFAVPDAERTRYHATAVVASNHVIALLGQVERLASQCGVPFEAFWTLARGSLDNAFALGPARALTGPVQRGDLRTVAGHLEALSGSDREAYRALAREAARLTGRRDSGLARLLEDLRFHEEHDEGNPSTADG
jgi:predicted short-subunit dehydrogenase-like oxidoreductase (DUF2520 family)